MTKTDESLVDLIDQLCGKITTSDFPDVRDAGKDDGISEADLKSLSSPKEWFEFLRDKKLLSPDDPSFIEHVFELCRRPDLLTIVLKYRLSNPGLEDESEIGRKLVRVRSAKKYTENCKAEDGQTTIKLLDPPKTRRKSSSAN